VESGSGSTCLNVTDPERSISFSETLGLTCTSRTEIEHAREAILEGPGKGSKRHLAQRLNSDDPVRIGSMWKLYVNIRIVSPSTLPPLRSARFQFRNRSASTGGPPRWRSSLPGRLSGREFAQRHAD
jgi:hypothetical protein